MNKKISKMLLLATSLFIIGFLAMDTSRVMATVPYMSERVNVTPTGAKTMTGTGESDVSVSQDGRYVAFGTDGDDIIAGDTNNWWDIFVRDRKLGVTVRATLSETGAELIGRTDSDFKMSANGRFVLFAYRDADITSGPSNGKYQLYVRDLKNNTTEIAALTSTGGLSDINLSVLHSDISADGRYIVFSTDSSIMVPGDTNGRNDVFIRDRKLGTTELMSKDAIGSFGNGGSTYPSVSCDGAYVTFRSDATNLVANDINGHADVFLVDRASNNSIKNITISANGVSSRSKMSCNGETLILQSVASNLVPGDTNGVQDIFAYNMADESFQRVSLDTSGGEISSMATISVNNSISFSGRYVIFETNASLDSIDTNGTGDVYLRDLVDATTQIVTLRNNGAPSSRHSNRGAISLDGRTVVFMNLQDLIGGGGLDFSRNVYAAPTGI